MITKELLYVEDALNHEKYLDTKCSEIAGKIEDSDLKAYSNQMAQKHHKLFQEIYGLL